VIEVRCRACRSGSGQIVLDLGEQPAADFFPAQDDPGPEPVYPLGMWLCASCGLAQLVEDPTVADEPKAIEPLALVEQAADAVRRVAAAGWLPPAARVVEFGSPHGGSWLGLLAERGLEVAPNTELADVVLDCFGLMHCADQSAAIAERAARVAPGGVLLVQFHSLAAIVGRGQWNALRHGHFAYYSAVALSRLLADAGFVLRTAWTFDLYGGTVLLAATRADSRAGSEPDESVLNLLASEELAGIRDPAVVGGLQQLVTASTDALRAWLIGQQQAGRRVLAYGAASRAVALLCRAKVSAELLPAVADASPAKQGSRMPATDIPVISPKELVDAAPDAVLLLLPDLLSEVRATLPGVEAAGGRWFDVEELLRAPSAGASTSR
jgi:C-methyltransferase C-terminal domain/Putative zinc binding domain/Methyltransferase domain